MVVFIQRAKAVLALVFSLVGASHAEPPSEHRWRRIEYPRLTLGERGESITVMVGSGGQVGEASHFRFDLLWSGPPEADPAEVIAKPGDIRVRLHLPQGGTLAPKDKVPAAWMGAGNARSRTNSIISIFPWSRNRLDEAWVELALPQKTFWIEIPYGFTRNVSELLSPTEEGRGEPVFPPAMAAHPEKDVLVPWLAVTYDLGEIQNRWRLSVKMANAMDARAEAILYRDDGRVGESIYRWSLDSPSTRMTIKTPSGTLDGHRMGIRLHEDGMRRSDTFHFNRDPAAHNQRSWGTASIQVGENAYEFLVPSSLFKYVHGVTDPANRQRILRGTDRP